MNALAAIWRRRPQLYRPVMIGGLLALIFCLLTARYPWAIVIGVLMAIVVGADRFTERETPRDGPGTPHCQLCGAMMRRDTTERYGCLGQALLLLVGIALCFTVIVPILCFIAAFGRKKRLICTGCGAVADCA